jgi:hypothetical protein
MDFPRDVMPDHALIEQEPVKVLDARKLSGDCRTRAGQLPYVVADVLWAKLGGAAQRTFCEPGKITPQVTAIGAHCVR